MIILTRSFQSKDGRQSESNSPPVEAKPKKESLNNENADQQKLAQPPNLLPQIKNEYFFDDDSQAFLSQTTRDIAGTRRLVDQSVDGLCISSFPIVQKALPNPAIYFQNDQIDQQIALQRGQLLQHQQSLIAMQNFKMINGNSPQQISPIKGFSTGNQSEFASPISFLNKKNIIDQQQNNFTYSSSNIRQDSQYQPPPQSVAITDNDNQKKIDDAIKNLFSDDFFQYMTSLLNQQVFEQKVEIKEEDIMRLSAFLLQTGLQRMESLSDYFESALALRTNIIEKLHFQFLAAALRDNGILKKFTLILIKIIDKFNKEKRIYTNSLRLFTDYSIDFTQRTFNLTREAMNEEQSQKEQTPTLILTERNEENNNDASRQHSPSPRKQFHSEQQQDILGNANKEQNLDRIFASNAKGELLVSLKLFTDEVFSSNPIFFDKTSSLFPSPQSVLANLYRKTEIKDRGKKLVSQRDAIYCFSYSFSTLTLCDINEGPLRTKWRDNRLQDIQRLRSTNHKLSDDSSITVDFNSLESIDEFRETIFAYYDANKNYIEHLKKINRYRPLSRINIQQRDSQGLRGFAEIIYTICQKIYTNLHNFGVNVEFRFLLTRVIMNIVQRASKLKSQIECEAQEEIIKRNIVSITFKRHPLTKTKHCKVCLVCSYENKGKKSKYSCLTCSKHFQRCITLCIQRCDRLFHDNPLLYVRNLMKYETQSILASREIVTRNIQETPKHCFLEQAKKCYATHRQLLPLIHPENSILLDSIITISKYQTSKRSSKKIQVKDRKAEGIRKLIKEQIKDMHVEYSGIGENYPNFNVNQKDLSSIFLSLANSDTNTTQTASNPSNEEKALKQPQINSSNEIEATEQYQKVQGGILHLHNPENQVEETTLFLNSSEQAFTIEKPLQMINLREYVIEEEDNNEKDEGDIEKVKI